MNNLETEAKIEVDYEIIQKVSEIIGKPRWNIQRNYIYKFDGGILRIRYENGRSFLTAKGKGLDCEYNKRPEIECEIPAGFFKAFSKLRTFLGNPFYYEKSRASASHRNCTVCLDNLEGRYFIEIEGIEEDIKVSIGELGLRSYPIEKRSYLEILMEEKRADEKKL